MSDNQNPSPPPGNNDASATGDLVSLDEATQSLGTGSAASTSGETVINAAEIFQQQLEQMTAWKQQLAEQMEFLRRDGAKLLERQKNLAVDKQKLIEERTQLAAQREQIQKTQSEVEAEARRLAQRAAEVEGLQGQLTQVQSQREQVERELAARQKTLVDLEARHLGEDVRLKEGLEQLEAQRRQLTETQRQVVQERDNLAAQTRELESRMQAFQQQNHTLSSREQSVEAARQQFEQSQSSLQTRKNELGQLETSLQARQSEVQAAEQQLVQERLNLQKQRQDMQRKLETLEREQAEHLEALAKQTKRLTERRAEVEAIESDVEKVLAARLAQATETFKEELNRSTAVQRERIFQLEEQLRQGETATRALQARESQLQQDISNINGQLAKLREELKGASSSLERISTERSSLAQQLSHQIEQAKQETAKWQQALESARAQAGSGQAAQDAQNEAAAVRKELETFKQQFAALQKAKEDLEFHLALKDEEQAKSLDTIKQDLRQAIAQRDAQIQELRQKLDAQPASGEGTSDAKTQELIARLQQERNDLASQLANVRDQLRRQHEESVLSKNVLEGKLLALEQNNAALESQRGTSPKAAPVPLDPAAAARAAKQADLHRQRLLRQAKALRAFRQQVKENQTALSASRAEFNENREQLRARRENLEQVKRLLEKQEMVMARKLADHNAIKTVAAVGIFVIMVLGSVFFGVYRFVHPVYRSEAVVQLAPPAELAAADLEGWLNRQVDYMQSSEITFAAWKILRGTEGHYAMHDVREEWLGSLAKSYKLSLNPDTRTINIRYSGQDAEGVSQVCNALAASYATPALRESSEQTRNIGTGAKIIAQATASKYPSEDNRMMICLTGVAITLFVSLVLVMIFRHFIARQLKEIDQMADAQDLADVKADIPETVKPAV